MSRKTPILLATSNSIMGGGLENLLAADDRLHLYRASIWDYQDRLQEIYRYGFVGRIRPFPNHHCLVGK